MNSQAEILKSRSKTGVVVEEIDETILWLELLVECEIIQEKRLEDLLKEANELLAIFASSQYTAKFGRQRNQWYSRFVQCINPSIQQSNNNCLCLQ